MTFNDLQLVNARCMTRQWTHPCAIEQFLSNERFQTVQLKQFCNNSTLGFAVVPHEISMGGKLE